MYKLGFQVKSGKFGGNYEDIKGGKGLRYLMYVRCVACDGGCHFNFESLDLW